MRKKKAAKKARISQPERRQRTQNRLLRAAIEILIERGYSNLTLDVVSRRAGVSRGAQTNYYPTKRSLLLATARQVVADGIPDQPSPGLPRTPTKADVLTAFIRESRKFFLSPRYTAMIELHVAGRHDPSLASELEALQRKAREAIDDVWLDRFTSAGVSIKDAKDIVGMTDHFFRGVALLACIQTRSPNARDVEPWVAALKLRFTGRSPKPS